MIARMQNNRVIDQADLFQFREDSADASIHFGDQPEVSRFHGQVALGFGSKSLFVPLLAQAVTQRNFRAEFVAKRRIQVRFG
jgi:hypothetical protein